MIIFTLSFLLFGDVGNLQLLSESTRVIIIVQKFTSDGPEAINFAG